MATHTAMKSELYLIEYYRKNPETGEAGWEINHAWVHAASNQEARAKLAAAEPLFDVVILCGRQAEVFPTAYGGDVDTSIHIP